MSDFSIDPQDVVEFWREAGPDRWFKSDPEFDEAVRQRFHDLYERAVLGDFDHWAEDATGALALVLLFDQFPRNMFRGTPQAFATDERARTIAKAALARGDADTVGEDVNQFLAMPFMHSEDLEDQAACVEWMERIGPENVSFAVEHHAIIQRFGRFPHRNAILGRVTTPDETAFLEDGGFAG